MLLSIWSITTNWENVFFAFLSPSIKAVTVSTHKDAMINQKIAHHNNYFIANNKKTKQSETATTKANMLS